MRARRTLTLDGNNSAISWDFTDGTHEITQWNSTGIFSQWPHGFQGVGFEFWKVDIVGSDVTLFSEFFGWHTDTTDSSTFNNGGFFGFLEGHAGTRSETIVPTPDPGTILACGLVFSELQL